MGREALEEFAGRVTEMISGLEGLIYKEGLQEFIS